MGDNERHVDLRRVELGKFEVTNVRGGTITTGTGDDTDFTPGELLLTAIASCTGADVDYLTARRSEPVDFRVRIDATKLVGENGNRLDDLVVTFNVDFGEGEGADRAREVLPVAVERSRDRLCTVGRTVEHGTPISAKIG